MMNTIQTVLFYVFAFSHELGDRRRKVRRCLFSREIPEGILCAGYRHAAVWRFERNVSVVCDAQNLVKRRKRRT